MAPDLNVLSVATGIYFVDGGGGLLLITIFNKVDIFSYKSWPKVE